MMKLLKTKASAAVLGVSLIGVLAASPAAHAAEPGQCRYSGESHLPNLKKTSPLMRGPLVRHAQCLLKRYHGHGSMSTDGIYGELTDAAVRAFQVRKGLRPVDGIVGPDTWNKLHQT